MTRYTADAEAVNHYLVDELPPDADEIFERAERGVDVVEAPAVTVAESVWTLASDGGVAGVDIDVTPREVARGITTDSPVTLTTLEDDDLLVFASLIDHHTLHDALLVANHRARDTEAIITSDQVFAGEATVW